jgi:hypothetical protein
MDRSSETRYCARGKQCTQYAQLGEPQKLNRYSESNICEPCQSAEPIKESQGLEKPEISKARDETILPGPVLPSSAEEEIRAHKSGMLISLHQRRGRFWELVKDLRQQRQITPKKGVPEANPPLIGPNPYLPEGGPEDPHEQDPKAALNEDPEAALTAMFRHGQWSIAWQRDLQKILNEILPDKYHYNESLPRWRRFVAACVIYNPPDDQLLNFIALGGPEPIEHYVDRIPDESEEVPRMLAPPIRTLKDLREHIEGPWGLVLYWYRELLESSDIDPDELHIVLAKLDPALEERYRRSLREAADRIFIEYDSTRSRRDYENAFKMLESTVESRCRKGRPRRDEIIAYQCAVLHDQCEWTYERITEHFHFGSIDTVERYVEDGREAAEKIQ